MRYTTRIVGGIFIVRSLETPTSADDGSTDPDIQDTRADDPDNRPPPDDTAQK